MSFYTAYVPHHPKIRDRVFHHPIPPCRVFSHISTHLEPLTTFMSKSLPPSYLTSYFSCENSPGGHVHLIFQANLGHPGDGEKSHSVQVGEDLTDSASMDRDDLGTD